MKKLGMALLIAAGIGCIAAFPAWADTEPFTTQDGVLSIELPDESWQEVEDQLTWVTLTNGSDVITMFHLSNGEKLPDVAVAGDKYSDVCQTFLSSKDEVFVITGSVRDSADFDQVREAVNSAEIRKKGTKTAVGSDNQSSGNETGSSDIFTDIDVTYYVNCSSLNVRSGNNASSDVIGHLSYGDAVKVTGYAANHWYRINYNGKTGYVYADYLTQTKPTVAPAAEQPSNPAPDFSDRDSIELYYQNGNTVHISQDTDGKWKDDSGLTYTCVSEDGTVWNNSEGSRLTMYDPWAVGEIPHNN